MVSIFNSWKEYTNILAMTSAQLIQDKADLGNQKMIQKKEKDILKDLTSKVNSAFIDSIEEDTEEVQMSFEEYLAKVNSERKENQVSVEGSVSMQDLDILMSSAEAEEGNTTDNISL